MYIYVTKFFVDPREKPVRVLLNADRVLYYSSVPADDKRPERAAVVLDGGQQLIVNETLDEIVKRLVKATAKQQAKQSAA